MKGQSREDIPLMKLALIKPKIDIPSYSHGLQNWMPGARSSNGGLRNISS